MFPRWYRSVKIAKLFLSVGAVVASAGTVFGQAPCTLNPVSTFSSSNGVWTLSPGVNQYQSAVSGPISPDGSSTYPAKRGVIPVQFSLSEGISPVVFQSIGSDGYFGYSTPTGVTTPIYSNDCSYLSYTPNAALTFSQLASQASGLVAKYSFTTGNCHGGSLRWSVLFSGGGTMFIYFGGGSAQPPYTDCRTLGPATNQSEQNILAMSDVRFETSDAPGTYKTESAAATWAAGQGNITDLILALDSGWQQDCGQTSCDQALTLGPVTVNNDTFTPPTPVGIGPTCALPIAQIQVTKTSGTDSGPVNSVLSVQPGDNNSIFRVVDCHYIYNLDVSSLSGAGTYTVSPLINGAVAGTATFTLK